LKLFTQISMKERTLEGFGERLAEIRQSRGLTQSDLAEKVGVSQRVIAYYEHAEAQPPGALLVDLAKTLQVSADHLLGLKLPKEAKNPKRARLMKRLQRLEKLPPTDLRFVLKMVDGLIDQRSRASA
jgi:transcriptional regulator with XRE-family HTH domain